MKYVIDGESYHLPSVMNDFQRELYIHLADWKRIRGADMPGYFKEQPYDLVFPDTLQDDFHIFPAVREKVKNLEFKRHKFFRHMASSQAACINLFVPLLQYPELAANILRTIKPDLAAIATEELDNGYQLEFWGENYSSDSRGFLNDHNAASGTDADIAIVYRDQENQLNLWLIEHKLSETEFTICAAASSKGRTTEHRCTYAADIYRTPSLCYYHSGKSYRYWEITQEANDLFPRFRFLADQGCPFREGLNQLWRNQLLAYAIEKCRRPFKRVYFSVIHHPGNKSLNTSIHQFKQFLKNTDRFFTFKSSEMIAIVRNFNYPELIEWSNWYQELYLWKEAW
jgi:hypothetical protein